MRAQKSFLRRHAVKLAASALITAGVLYTVHAGGLKMVPDKGDFGNVHWIVVALYAPLLAVMTWFRSVRWRFLLRQIIDVPKLRLFAVSCAGFLMILLLPFRLGELARPYMLRTRPEDVKPGQPVLSMTAATSSIVAERVIDGMFISVVLAIALFTVPTLHPLPKKVMNLGISVEHVRMLGFGMLGLFSVAFTTIAVFYFARKWAIRATEVVIGIVSRPLATKLANFAAHLADGLHVFRRGRDFLGFLFETAIYWGLNALGMWLIAYACGVVHADGSAITFGESCTLLGMLSCTILIPGPPGLLGVFQAGIYAGMTMYFPTAIVAGPGAAYVFVLYASQVLLGIVAGGWGLWHEGGTRRLQGALAPEAT
ncbi:MAG TPA: lysylphosphatidylglycerol synthase transmembrane domain-containing protein [Kofleriaceae bacterium]